MGMSDDAPIASMIGIRAGWRCCTCHEKAVTHQLVDAGNPALDLPRGWSQRKGRTYCGCTAQASTDLILKERTQ